MMKPILPYILFTILSFFVYNVSFGQGCHVEGTVIINEIGNFGRNDEYVELLVIGSSSNPTAPVNLEGYIIDDNNFVEVQVGSEPGYLQLGQQFKSVLPGTLILIYNAQNTTISSGNDGFDFSAYRIQTNSEGLLGCEFNSQVYSNYDQCSPQSVTDTRKFIPMRNWGDVLQVRNPEGELVHAISWVKDYEYNDDARTIYIKPEEGNFTLSNTCVRFKIGKDWYNMDNYEISSIPDKTPGLPNSAENVDFINRLKNGTLNRNFKSTFVVKNQPTTLNDNDGEIAIYCQGGVPPYSVVVDGLIYEYPGEGATANDQGVIYLKKLFANNYRLVVGDRNSCGEIRTINLENAKQICSGECIEIGDDSNELCNYTWTNGQQGAAQTVCPTTATTYTLNGIDENGIQVEQNYTVEVKRAKLIANYPVVCGPAPAVPGTVSISCQDPYVTYKWDNNSTLSQRNTNYPGNYSVSVTDAEGCSLEGSIYIYDGNNYADIKAFFVGLGFEQDNTFTIYDTPGKQPDSISNRVNTNLCFNNFSNSIIQHEDKIVDYNTLELNFCNPQYLDRVYITENADFCSDHIEALVAFNNPDLKVLWVHLYRFGEESILFFFGKPN